MWMLLWLAAAAAQTGAPRPAPENRQREATTYTLPPDQLARAIEYHRAEVRLHFIGVAYGILVLAGLLACKVAPRFRAWAEAGSRRRIVQAYVFGPLLFLAIDVLSLPLPLYDHHLSLKFDQSIQGWGSWFWDWTKGELIEFVLAGAMLWILYGVIRRSPRRWWFYFWLAAIPIVVFLMFIAPVAIQPLFYRFTPLAEKQPALVAEIGKVTARGGLEIPRDRMYEMNASEKLKSLNAYVAGIGASKRVVVWDTAMQKMTTEQILFVFGHEMGHYVMHHIYVGIMFFSIVTVLAFSCLRWALDWTLQRWGAKWQIRGVDDPAVVPLVVLLALVFIFVATPISNTFSRTLEYEADMYGLNTSRQPDGEAQADIHLGEYRKMNPGPIEEWIFFDHPSGRNRIYAAMRWKAENLKLFTAQQ